MITIDDIRCDVNQSGFRNVTANGARTNWRASSGNTTTSGGRTPGWRGPSRATPEAAAQDYVDYINLTGGRIRARRGEALHPRRRTVRRQRELSAAEQVAQDIVTDARGWKRGQPGWIYIVGEKPHLEPCDLVKIGGTVADPPEQRLGDYQVGNPRPLYMHHKVRGSYVDEQRLHRLFAFCRVRGEWFRYTPAMLTELEEVPLGA